jgi:hypothetical protein
MRGIVRLSVAFATVSLLIGGLSVTAGAKVPKPKPKATPQIMVTASPNPVVETSTSNVAVVIQVESNPSNAGSNVTISSTQLSSRCATTNFHTFNSGVHAGSITITLDNDGNALVILNATDCAPGSALIDASLDAPPFSTAITKLVIEPPQVTAPGLHVFPNPEVEAGDGVAAVAPAVANVASEAEFVFYIETNPVYAEQSASITSDQLTERCGGGSIWENSAGTFVAAFDSAAAANGVVAISTAFGDSIDNDGNYVFDFWGSSCAAGKSVVIAEIGAGGPTYSAQATILPPAVTI